MTMIKTHMMSVVKDISKTKLLSLMQNKLITEEKFKFYIIQRISIARNFEGLLVAGINKAKSLGDNELEQTLRQNLADERGEDENGEVHHELAHNTWRQHFLSALEITNELRETTSLLPQTVEHLNIMRDLESNGDLFSIGGALIGLELIIPVEYRNVKICRDYLFPNLFVSSFSDSVETKEHKAKASLYINDHISHDLKSHFPALLKALSKYDNSQKQLAKIIEAVELIKYYRKNFYKGIEDAWSTMDNHIEKSRGQVVP